MKTWNDNLDSAMGVIQITVWIILVCALIGGPHVR
jgi:hypothetical protein